MKKLVMMIILGLSLVSNTIQSNWNGCGGRLERALDAMQRDSSRKNRHDEDEHGIIYQRKLISAPLEMIVANVAVKLPHGAMTNRDDNWARVDRCYFEPGNNSLRSRVMLNDLSVSGVVSLVPNQRRVSILGESCRMNLRLRRAGIEFITSPIARTHGQMRIRTESNFLEPRFASIYAYNCRPTNRIDKQIKRHDKPNFLPSPITVEKHYDAIEPRNEEHKHLSREEEIVIANENSASAFSLAQFDFSPTRKSFWITKLPGEKRKKRSNTSIDLEDYIENTMEKRYQHLLNGPSYEIIDWQSKENVAREMEDVFLRGASEALTKYIEHELHPAIKETLMISMGYTISYG
ncbi:hypothetical protein PV328_006847 [Microctonus aethiopoides]|uniref:Uncharacterized protein n=1 Tax=Microctonus aethiopoides TaxID=144406 RepID=A0AA39FQL7_9HYME|nr:hypothetical protein PV328_006847 [Microctonus aethiopoides]